MFINLGKFKRRRSYQDINPEDVFLDSANLPGFESSRFEGRIEKPITHGMFLFMKTTLVIVGLVLVSKLWILAIMSFEIRKRPFIGIFFVKLVSIV